MKSLAILSIFAGALPASYATDRIIGHVAGVSISPTARGAAGGRSWSWIAPSATSIIRPSTSTPTTDPTPPGTSDPVEGLADAALAPLLPPPAIQTNPLSFATVVGLQTWLWVSNWQPVSTVFAVGGLPVRATATPTLVRWTTDVASTVCQGPGTPYQDSVPPSQQKTDCAIVFPVSSATEPPPPGDQDANDGAFVLTAAISWAVRWQSPAGSATGGVPLETRASTYVRVEQVQSIGSVA